MATKRYISTSFWKDNYVVRLDPTEKLIFNYLLTNPYTTIAGVYEINVRETAFDTGFDTEVVKRALEKFMTDGKIIYYKEWIVLRNWIKHLSINPSVSKGIDRTLHGLPDFLKEFVITSVSGEAIGIDCDSLYKGCIEGATYSTLPNGTNLTVLTQPNGTNEPEGSVDDERVLKKKPAPRQRTIEINGMYQYWEATVGYAITAKRDQNRKYAGYLLNDYDKTEIAEAMHAAARASVDQFAPRVADFITLYKKWDELKLWDKRQVRGGASKTVSI